jgi:RecA-family ATPase
MGGQGKTTLLTQLAADLSAGVSLFGHASLTVSGPQRVAVYIAEDPLSEVRFRFKEQCKTLGYQSDVTSRLTFLDFGGRRISLENETDRTILFRSLRESKADVAILDPLVAIHDSDENSNAAMRKVLDTLSPLSAETGMAFFVAHHEPKTVDNPHAAARGASAIRDWARTMLRLTAHGKGESGSSRYSLDLDKANYGGTVWSLTLERIFDSYIFTVSEDKNKVTSMQVWETVGPEERWFTDVIKDIETTFTVHESTAKRAVKKAEEQSVVIIGEKPNPDTGRSKKTLARGHGKVTDDE